MNLFADVALPTLDVKARTVLLAEGQVASHLYVVRQGCVRIWLNHRGKDLTAQFFVEGEAVASLESFLTGEPSEFTIETVEACTLDVLSKAEFDRLMAERPDFREWFQQLTTRRLIGYVHHLLAYIRDTPQERYEDLVKNRPQLLQRVPQHYIASYLGITGVSLSRIRNRK
ncbi:Crp/Fnr family transcriptional regulator [Hymenobacter lapidiphilus]|uniref:Crp/Fnr family transcriptional regulator n=1 Tax=Hymenobacter sp. CCM 8763 TaxID=2303334 RepID=UPI0011C11C61|nr:Crp/Fnr family transcriptional regulator [Hymenobacter sp. CCM 8763]